jgi:hypothetical protein
MRPDLPLVVILGLATFSPGSAEAALSGLNGSTVTYTGVVAFADLDAPDQVRGPLSAVVGPGIEFGLGDQSIPGGAFVGANYDISASRVEIEFTPALGSGVFFSAVFNGPVLGFTGAPDILGVTLDASFTTLALAAADITFLPNRIWINVEGLAFRPGDRIGLDLTITPIPAALPLLATALGAGGMLAYRRRTASAP